MRRAPGGVKRDLTGRRSGGICFRPMLVCARRPLPTAEAAARRLRLKPRPVLSLQRQSVGRAAALAACLAVAAARPLHPQCPDGTPPPCVAPRRTTPVARPPAEAERRRSFLVLPFRNVSRAAEHEWLVEGSPILLADALSRWDELRIVPDERLYPALRRAGLQPGAVMDLARVRRVAAETGGWTAVTGDVLVVGGRIRVSARAFDAVTNREMVRTAEEVPPGEDVRVAYERIGAHLLRAAGLEATAPDLAGATTRSLDAYRAYVRGIAHANRSEARRARDAFQEAVRLDSSFAQAYAKLAEAALNVNPADIVNPRSPAFAHAQRAATLADRLPPREREVVLALNELLAGRFAAARERLRRLIVRDSTHVDALEWLMSVEGADPILVSVPGGERPRGSWNTGLRLAKLVLELDPARHDVYQNLVQFYLIAGGGTPGFVPAYREEMGSLAALFSSPPERTFVPLLGDTVMLVPMESLATYAPDSLTAARQRAIAAARAWVTRWLAAGSNEAESHLWASRVHDLAGDLEAALRELNAADSIGVETGLENVPARRMALLARMGRYADGSRIADSLWRADALDMQSATGFQIEGIGWAHTLFVLNGQHDRAAALLERTAVLLAPAALARPELGAEALAVVFLGGYVRQFFALPREVRVTVVERLLGDAGHLPSTGILARMVPFQVRLLLRDTLAPEVRLRLGERLLAAATALADSGRGDQAFELAHQAAGDTALQRTIDSVQWFARRRATARAERSAEQRRFRPVAATVSDTAAVFAWQVEGERFTWYRVETAIGESDYHWTAEFEVGGKHYEVLTHVDRTPGSRSRSGSLTDLLGSAIRVLHEVDRDTTVPHRPVGTAVVRAEAQPGGFRMVLRDRAVVDALRRERPAAARFRFRPCEPDPAAPCVDELVAVRYP